MTRVTIIPVPTKSGQLSYHAVAGTKQSTGHTAGEALDSITKQLPTDQTGTLVIVQNQQPDRFFSATQQQRLSALMGKWRRARDQGEALSEREQAELEELIEAELKAATARSMAIATDLTP